MKNSFGGGRQKKKAHRRLIFLWLIFLPGLSWSQGEAIETIERLELEAVAPGTVRKYWLRMGEDALSRPVCVPVLVARGAAPGPVLGLAAAIHGDELNGIRIIQQVFETLDPAGLRGAVVGVPGLNAVSIPREERRFPEGEDLNRLFPGRPDGDVSAQYVHRLFERLVRPMDVLIDMHTASFGRVNALYVRADLSRDTLAGLARLQGADIVLNSRGPSAGAQSGGGTLRDQASRSGIHAITVEYGNPQVYQPEMIDRGVRGVQNTLVWLGMTAGEVVLPDASPILCRRSYWLYTDAGGLLEVYPAPGERIRRGALIAVLRDPFGSVVQEYRASEDGVVIGKSTNPVNYNGGRILHLGIEAE